MPVIRPAAEGDEPSLWRLLGQLAISYQPDEAAFASTIPLLKGREDVVLLVAEADATVVGYLLGIVLPTLFANGPILAITELVVDAPMRGTGIGRKLTAEAVDGAWTLGCVEVVTMTTRAATFYEGLGFIRSADYLQLKRPAK